MSEGPERARLFVALDLPAPVRDELADWTRRELDGRAGLRLIEPAMLHVTLCFLGWREASEADGIAEAALACAGPVEGLAVGPAAWLPPRRPRVLAVDLEDPTAALSTLQARVEAALGLESEPRPYRPHVTVARVRGHSRLRAFELDPPRIAPFGGAALTLYRSRLERRGAHYVALARAEL